MHNHKVKIVVLGALGCGKSRISNFLADATHGSLPANLRPTYGVRILEFEVPNLKTQGNVANVDVQLWDCSGDERYMSCWPAIRSGASGIIFIYSPNDLAGIRTLESFYNYFVNQQGFSHRQCIVLSHNIENSNNDIQPAAKLPPVFSRISQANVNIETSGERLRFDFNQFLATVVNSVKTQ